MGAFGVLGSAAGGFHQAYQEDMQRQFADLAARRGIATELLGHIATDPNQDPSVRAQAGQSILGIISEKPGSKFSLDKHLGPVLGSAAQVRMGQAPPTQSTVPTAGPPPPPFGMNMTGGPPLPPSGIAAGLPAIAMQDAMLRAGTPQWQAAQAGPQPLPNATPAMQGQAQLTPLQSAAAPSAGGPPLPSSGFTTGPTAGTNPGGIFGNLAGPSVYAQNAANAAGLTSQQELMGQMQARSTMADRIMQDPQYSQMIAKDPMMAQMLMAMKMGVQLPYSMYNAMNRPVGTGSELSADEVLANPKYHDTAVAQGIAPGSGFYNIRELAGGKFTFNQTRGPGQMAGPNNTLINQDEAAAAREAAKMPFWKQRFGMQAALRMQLQDRAFNYAKQLGDFKTMDNIYGKAWTDMQERGAQYRLMQNLMAKAESPGGDQQADVALANAHIGMTTPIHGRVSRASFEEAVDSGKKLGLAIAKFYHYNKDDDTYEFDGWKGGINLTHEQRQNMLDLAKDRVETQNGLVERYKQDILNSGGYLSPTLSPSSGNQKPRGGGPPKQGEGGGGSAPPEGNDVVHRLINKHRNK